MTFAYTLAREPPLAVWVEGSYFPGSRGYRDSLGVPESPDEPPEFEIDSIEDVDGWKVEITEDEAEAIQRAALEHCRTSWED